ncbi:hypothetical protein [Amycolatopsis sp. Hca4]|uniref:hypothetical protein n=1 Tax=Amycolatopsis sp. Hca4 TaxID=2742131 RepID=UPI0015901840|nr:hypothetical protein [Amycolatopsis sp. Hca4]QKV74095.1 hypothetical protein HUT10_10175 [Amycolatopsis sp. Hca4]
MWRLVNLDHLDAKPLAEFEPGNASVGPAGVLELQQQPQVQAAVEALDEHQRGRRGDRELAVVDQSVDRCGHHDHSRAAAGQ